MRIGMFSWESLYSIKVGGVAPHISELSKAIARRSHDVHVFTRHGDFDSFDRINGVHYQRADSDRSGYICLDFGQHMIRIWPSLRTHLAQHGMGQEREQMKQEPLQEISHREWLDGYEFPV